MTGDAPIDAPAPAPKPAAKRKPRVRKRKPAGLSPVKAAAKKAARPEDHNVSSEAAMPHGGRGS